MYRQNKVSGVVLAGGQARRMHQQDKGLVNFKQRRLIDYALSSLSPLVDEVLISANRNQSRYAEYGYPVIADGRAGFDGPLAGILAAMQFAQHPVLLTMPCDTPFVETIHLQRLLDAFDQDTEIATVYDGLRLHPVFLVMKTSLQSHLQAYLASGQRKLESWITQHQLIKVDFSDVPEVYANINNLTELSILENQQ